MSVGARRVVEIAARLLPARHEDRNREEWLAELDGADDLGVSRASIAAGALRYAVGARISGRLSTLEPRIRAVRLARWALVPILFALLAPAVLFFGIPSSLLAWNAAIGGAVVLLTIGVALLARALHVAGKPWWLALLVVVVPIPLAPMVMIPMGGLVLGLSVVVGTAVFLSVADRIEHGPRKPSLRRHRVAASITATVVLLGVCAAGLFDGLVVQPLAMTDDAYGLDDVYAMLQPEEVQYGVGMIVAWAAGGLVTVLALGVVPLLLRGRAAAWLGARRIVMLGLGAACVGLLAFPWSTFSLGMSISDTVPPMAGGVSDLTRALMLLAGALAVTVIVGTLPPRRLPRATASS